jgi:mono/diheme cytochrome c family protein
MRSTTLFHCIAGALLLVGCTTDADTSENEQPLSDHVANGRPFLNRNGAAASTSTQGFVDMTGDFFTPHGTNGRSCASCHAIQDAWSLTPARIQWLFFTTQGLDPLFNPLDAKNPTTDDFTTVWGRWNAYENLLEKGVFRRGGAPRAERDWDLVAVDDPNGFATTSRMVTWHRTMPLINLPLGAARIHWDGALTGGDPPTVRGGLETQATKSIPGAQQAPAPAPPEVIANIVDFEISLFAAQTYVYGAGNLVDGGATGGPDQLAQQEQSAGRFDLFDAWIGDDDRDRAQIARGQEVFNTNCNSCHNSRNNGTNVEGKLFDTQTASAEVRTRDQTLHTFALRADPTLTVQLTDPGLGNVTGLFSDLGKFKVPTLRALAARAPYFHDGRVRTLRGVVEHYERFLGLHFTSQERDDLVAFLGAL